MKNYIQNKLRKFDRKKIINIAILIFIASLLLYFQKDIILAKNSDDTIFLEKVSSMSYFQWITERYLTWSSRVGAETLIYFFLKTNLFVWKIFNVLAIFLLAYSINRIFKKKVEMLDFVFVLLSFALIGQRILTSSSFCFHGSFNYLWPAALGLFALIFLADSFLRKESQSFGKYAKFLYPLAILLTVLSNEQIGLVLLAFFALFIGYSFLKKEKVAKEVFAYFLLTLILLAFVLLAPGNSVRYHAEIGRWYPDFKQITFEVHLKRNLVWFYEKMFDVQRYLLLILGIATSICYWKKTKKRNHVLEIMIALVVALVFIKGLKNYDDYLFEFSKKGFFTLQYLFWSTYMIALMYSLFKIDNKKFLNLLIFAAGVATMLLMWFSPTIYASANRILLVNSIFFIVLINKLRIEYEIEIKKYILLYAIFAIINLWIIMRVWEKGFMIKY